MDKRFVDEYVKERTKEHSLLSTWLEDFRAKFGEYEEANYTIQQVESALKLFNDVVGAAKLKIDIQKAIDDRSILENGVEWHLERFITQVSQLCLTYSKNLSLRREFHLTIVNWKDISRVQEPLILN